MTSRAWPGPSAVRRWPLLLGVEAAAVLLAAWGKAFKVGAVGTVLAALAWQPALTSLGFFLVVEEVETSATSEYYRKAPRLLTGFTELYSSRVAGLAMPLVLLGAAFAWARLRPVAEPRSPGPPLRPTVVPVLVALVAWSFGLSVLQDHTLEPATITRAISAAGPWLAAIAAYGLCRLLAAEGLGEILWKAVAAIVVAKAAMAVLVEVLYQGVTVDGQRFVVFFDAAGPALAAAIVLGFLVTRRTTALDRGMLAAAALVVLVSFRRSVWLFVLVGAAVTPLVTRRAQVLGRLVLMVVLGLSLLFVLPGPGPHAVTKRALSAFGAVGRSYSPDSSTRLHVGDLGAGLDLARHHPVAGLGVRAAQPPGLAVAAAPGRFLYVHNDFLQVWLRYGLPGLVLFIWTLLRLGRRGAALVAGSGTSAWEAGCAMFGILLAVPIFTAAFVSTTFRWPVLMGLSAAVVDSALARRSPRKNGGTTGVALGNLTRSPGPPVSTAA